MDFFKFDRSKERQILDFRPLGFQDVILLGRYRYVKARSGLEDHNHGDMLEVCYLERGKQTYYVGQDRFDLVGGDAFITFPGEVHGTGPAPEEKGILFWMLIHVVDRTQSFLWLPPAAGERLVDRLLHVPARHFPAGEALGKILHRIFAAHGHDDSSLKIPELQNLILRFLLDLLDASQHSERRISAEIAEVQKFIARNIDSMLTVTQLARLIGLSDSRFKGRFKAEVGISPNEYMMRLKIDRAKELLLDQSASVTDVAMQLGFSTSHYFAEVFRRYTGAAPSQYRSQDSGSVVNPLSKG